MTIWFTFRKMARALRHMSTDLAEQTLTVSCAMLMLFCRIVCVVYEYFPLGNKGNSVFDFYLFIYLFTFCVGCIPFRLEHRAL